MISISDLQTGDLLLFDENPSNYLMKTLDFIIKYSTECQFSHSAIILKDPTFISPLLKGTYVWESSYHGIPDAEDDDVKFGVQIMPFDLYLKKYPGNVNIYVRKCPENALKLFTDAKLKRIHDKVHNKPYDLNPIDWFDSYKHIHKNIPTDKRFFCSAFCCYLLTHIGIMSSNTDWSSMSCADLKYTSSAINWNYKYSKEVIIS